ncbi:MAG: hypothetical protein ETSY1_15495 [Candidatus Entotheonella factor]|uniref:Tetratricopeptide repeat protein n=1 Tax=Entotheonella factor TaxID=1429438 RepID=W4LMX7_ENTF1|nr:tetratricopeptide repeat protein [Candidatus Entotheonella palauensis]ETW99302.1 MAG: hypothetical protein ETSY1_15495 [Candidatus Entotheonella factor]
MPSQVSASYKVDLAKALGETGEQEYARLMRVLLAAQGLFALVPVASDFSVEAREQLIQRLKQDLQTQGIALHIVSLNRERWDVLQALAEAAPPAGTPAVIAVVGLEETPGLVQELGTTPRRPPALALLNNTREGVRAQFPFPLILWCAPLAFVALQEHAPDFYDHFVGLAEFLDADPQIPLAEQRRRTSDTEQVFFSDPTNLPGSQAAVAFYTDLVERHPEPSHARARGLLGLAEVLWSLSTADVETRLAQALEATEEALTLLIDMEPSSELARGKVIQGNILRDLPTAERAYTLASAIQNYEEALQIYTEQEFPEQWAATQVNLGNVYQELPIGNRGTNIQQAITFYQAALRVRTEHDFPVDWAMIQNSLGAAHQNLPTSDKATNLQQAIDYHRATLRVYTEHAFPVNWAITQNNLGAAYMELPTGDRASNLRLSITCYEAALRVCTEHDFPIDWARTQYNLGVAYQILPTGDRATNLQQAIAYYEAALRVHTEHDFPVDWADTQHNLGIAYQELSTGDRTANLKHAITCFKAAARGYEAAALTEEADQVKQLIASLQEQQH